MNPEEQVAAHYTSGSLEQRMMGALQAAGKDLDHLSTADLALVDNFHVGGQESIEALSAFMSLRPGMHLLDVGCGVGGPARYFAERGFDVTGIDLTDEFVSVATSLTYKMKLDAKAHFRQGSAVAIPFADNTFDGAYMIHVGMNMPDKAGVFREVARVLNTGARFSIFDILSARNDEIAFPLPWASNAEDSFVRTLEDYRRALEAAGFRIEHERDRRKFAVDFTENMRAHAAAAGGPPVLGVHLLMGEQAPLMLKNVNTAIAEGKLAPTELVGVKK